MLAALGLDRDDIKDFVLNEGLDELWERIRKDGEFVKAHKLESVHETLTLDYPSYILAMGAGKTILIGAIVAGEFAMALEYPDGPLIQNALVFAPGLTILESLRELAEVPYEKILPPRLYRPFEATYKLIFIREGEKDLPVIRRLNDPRSPHRVILLVNKGTEGWDCPSLFACALARKLKRSQNFVLQASTRCLRQVPGNPHKARIYLSMDNRGALDRQLQETYGETIAVLNRASQNTRTARLVVRKLDVPPLVVTKILKRVVPVAQTSEVSEDLGGLRLEKPGIAAETVLVKKVYSPQEQSGEASVLKQMDEERVTYAPVGPDLYSAATELAAVYRLDVWTQPRLLHPAKGWALLHRGDQDGETARRRRGRRERPQGHRRAKVGGVESRTAQIRDGLHLIRQCGVQPA